MPFLDKLKRKVEVLENEKAGSGDADRPKKELNDGSSVAQLDVDIFETPASFVVIGMIPGVDLTTLNISISEENDVLVIEGTKESPIEKIKDKEKTKNLISHHQECHWGAFYRQIVLPQEVNPEMIEAHEEKGVLFITLPILRLKKGKKNIQVITKD